MTLIERAYLFAAAAHASIDQRRRYTNDPYIEHPKEVAGILSAFGFEDEAIAAALLHDVLEDVHAVDEALLRREFGDPITTLVIELTSPSKGSEGTRAERKARDIAALAAISDLGQSIKVADIISNVRSIVDRDPTFARVYLPEKRAALDVLVRAHPELRAMALSLVEKGQQRLQ